MKNDMKSCTKRQKTCFIKNKSCIKLIEQKNKMICFHLQSQFGKSNCCKKSNQTNQLLFQLHIQKNNNECNIECIDKKNNNEFRDFLI